MNKVLYQTKLFLLTSNEKKDVKIAVQSGPIIAIPGKIIGNLMVVDILGPDIIKKLAL
ncbi:MAG: hypothetical protein ACOC1W_00655 [Bacillota bacterium]